MIMRSFPRMIVVLVVMDGRRSNTHDNNNNNNPNINYNNQDPYRYSAKLTHLLDNNNNHNNNSQVSYYSWEEREQSKQIRKPTGLMVLCHIPYGKISFVHTRFLS